MVLTVRSASCGDGVQIYYNDSKMFWKPAVTLDIVLAFHSKQHVLEVAVYNSALDKEAPRIYLDGWILKGSLDCDELDAKFSERKEKLATVSHRFHNHEVYANVEKSAVVRYVMARLRPIEAFGGGVALVALPGDAVADEVVQRLECVFEFKPTNITPIEVAPPKKVSHTDSGMHEMLLEMESELREATRLASVTSASAGTFRRLVRQSVQWKTFSLSRLRWHKVVNRLVIDGLVKRTRQQLEAIEERRRQKELDALRELAASREIKEFDSPAARQFPRILRKHQDGGSPRSSVSLRVSPLTSAPGSRASSPRVSLRSKSHDHPSTDADSLRSPILPPLSRSASPRLQERGIAPSAPSLVQSFATQATARPRTLPTHRAYNLDHAISRVCGGDLSDVVG